MRAIDRAILAVVVGYPVVVIVLVVVGAIALLLVPASPRVEVAGGLSVMEALFTATSAVTLTGLELRSAAYELSLAGQVVVLVLMQLGAWAAMFFGSVAAVRVWIGSTIREAIGWRRFLLLLFCVPLVAEGVGGVGLWIGDAGNFWESVFLAVSGLCNGGFDISGHGTLRIHASGWAVHGVLVPLMVVGGVGVPSWAAALPARRPGEQVPRASRGLKRHVIVVLGMMAGLYLVGVVGIGVSELVPYGFEAMGLGQTAGVQRPGPLDAGAVGEALVNASFGSISVRTTGFHIVPMDEVRPASLWVMMGLMCIGGATGGAAGGVGVVTLAAVLGVRLPATYAVRAAVAVLVAFSAFVVAVIFLLLLVEPAPFEHLVLEGMSAATNTGLSLGVTQGLTAMGRAVLIVAMVGGRVLPVVVLMWISQRVVGSDYDADDAAGSAPATRPGHAARAR